MSEVIERSSRPGMSYWLVHALPFIVLYGVAVVLAARTQADPAGSLSEWLWFVPFVAAVSVVSGWGNVSSDPKDKAGYLIRQALHWGGLAVVLYLLFIPGVYQFIPSTITGFTIFFLLGLTAYLAGVHTDWRMMLFGASLLAGAVVIALVTAWSVVLIGIAGAGVAITLIGHRLTHRHGESGESRSEAREPTSGQGGPQAYPDGQSR